MLRRFVGGTRGKTAEGDAFSLDVVDPAGPEGGSLRRVPLGFLAHGVSFHRSAPNRALVFEKRGPGGAVVDLEAGRKTADVAPSPGRHFYGHAAFSGDGERLFVVETDLASHAGVITERDGKTLAVLRELPTFGDDPHDCVLLEDRRTLAITNAGAPLGTQGAAHEPSVTFVDTETGSLVERFTFGDPKINAGHIAVTERRDFVVASAPRNGLPEETSVGGVTIRTRPGKPERMRAPKELTDQRLLGESLSVCIDGDVAVVTTPLANVVSFWSLSRKRCLGTLELEFPRGVLPSGQEHLVWLAYGRALPEVTLVDLRTRERVSGPELPKGICSGSHLFRWEH